MAGREDSTRFGLLGFVNASDDQLFARQERNGLFIYFIAWVVEILAAGTGLFLAAALGLASYEILPVAERDFGTQIRAIGGVLPFLIIAVIEPTKIFLASGLYHAKPFIWKILFAIGLSALTVVTFETILGGLIQQNANISKKVTEIQIERDRVKKEIISIEGLLEGEKSQSVNLDNNNTARQISENKSIREQMRDAEEDFAKRKLELDTNLKLQLNNVQSDIDESGDQTKLQQDIDLARKELSGIQTKYENLINPKIAARNKLIADRNDELGEVDKDFRLQKTRRKREIENRYNSLIARHNNDISELEAKRDNEEEPVQKRIATLERNLAQNTSTASSRIEQREKDRERIREQFETSFAALENDHKAKIDRLTEGEKTARIALTRYKNDQIVLDNQYRQEASSLQIIQFSKMICGTLFSWCFDKQNSTNASRDDAVLDIADIPQEKINTIAGIWFGSIALIAATMGTFLAFASFVLRDPKAYKKEGSRTLRTLIKNFGEGFVATGQGIGAFIKNIGSGIGTMFEIIGASFKIISQSFRSLSIDFRRYWRRPKIKFQEVEVERVVEKKVEVPVDKIVYKEVPKEIIRKEIVYVPLYSTDNGTVQVEPSQFSDLAKGFRNQTEQATQPEAQETQESQEQAPDGKPRRTE